MLISRDSPPHDDLGLGGGEDCPGCPVLWGAGCGMDGDSCGMNAGANAGAGGLASCGSEPAPPGRVLLP